MVAQVVPEAAALLDMTVRHEERPSAGGQQMELRGRRCAG